LAGAGTKNSDGHLDRILDSAFGWPGAETKTLTDLKHANGTPNASSSSKQKKLNRGSSQTVKEGSAANGGSEKKFKRSE